MGKIMNQGMEVIAVLVAFGLVGITVGIGPYYDALSGLTNVPSNAQTILEVFPGILLAVVALTGIYKLTN